MIFVLDSKGVRVSIEVDTESEGRDLITFLEELDKDNGNYIDHRYNVIFI